MDDADFITVYKSEVSNLQLSSAGRSPSCAKHDQLSCAAAPRPGAGEFEPIDATIVVSSITGMFSFIVDRYLPRSGLAEMTSSRPPRSCMRMAGAPR